MEAQSFFSINHLTISLAENLAFNLYVNSSSLKGKQKFIKILKVGQSVTLEDLEEIKDKYYQIYINESERKSYIQSLVRSDSIADIDAANFLKDSAIGYLHDIFDSHKEFSTELLVDTIENCRDCVESMIDVLDDYNINSVQGLIGNLSGHDFYTYDHSINVSMYSIMIFRLIKPDATRLELVHAGLGGLLHDLGKIKIPTRILNAPSGLTDDEYLEIKKHPQFGYDLLTSGEVNLENNTLDLNTISRVIYEHHENWDGTGYPQKIKGNEIHILARVCAIADFFDAVTTKRAYSNVLSIEKAIGIMEKTKGKKLDARIFDIFSKSLVYVRGDKANAFKMHDSFDPSIPYEQFPLEELYDKEDFGKIKIIDKEEKK